MPICWFCQGQGTARVGLVTEVRIKQGEVDVQEGNKVSTFYFKDMTSLHEAGSAFIVNEILRLRALVVNREKILRETSDALAALARKTLL